MFVKRLNQLDFQQFEKLNLAFRSYFSKDAENCPTNFRSRARTQFANLLGQKYVKNDSCKRKVYVRQNFLMNLIYLRQIVKEMQKKGLVKIAKHKVEIIDYLPKFHADFKRLNYEWIEKYFKSEKSDHQSPNSLESLETKFSDVWKKLELHFYACKILHSFN